MTSKNPYARYESRIYPQKLNSLPDIASLSSRTSASQPLPKQPLELLNQNVDRYKNVETRLAFAEQATSAIVEDLSKTQTEMKAQLKRLDEILTNEVHTRKGLDMALQGNRNQSSRVEDNVKRLEMFRMEDQKVLALLMTQVKVIEQRLLIGQKDMADKRDMDMNHMSQINLKVMETTKSKEHLETTMLEQIEALRNLRSQVEVQSKEMNVISQDLTGRLTRLEMENKLTQGCIRSNTENLQSSEHLASQLKSLIEKRFNELTQSIYEVRGQQEGDKNETKMIENRVYSRLNEVESLFNEQLRMQEKTFRSMDMERQEGMNRVALELSKHQNNLKMLEESALKENFSKIEKLKKDLDDKVSEIFQNINNYRQDKNREMKSLKEALKMSDVVMKEGLENLSSQMFKTNEDNKSLIEEKLDVIEGKMISLGEKLEEHKKDILDRFEDDSRQAKLREIKDQVNSLEVQMLREETHRSTYFNSLKVSLTKTSKFVEDMSADLNQKQEELKTTLNDLNSDLGKLIEEKVKIQESVHKSQKTFHEKIDNLSQKIDSTLKNKFAKLESLKELKMRTNFRIKRLAEKMNYEEDDKDEGQMERTIEDEEQRIEMIEKMSQSLKMIKKRCKVLKKELKAFKAANDKENGKQRSEQNIDNSHEMNSFKSAEQRMNYLTLKIKMLESRIRLLERIDEGSDDDDDDDDEGDDNGIEKHATRRKQ